MPPAPCPSDKEKRFQQFPVVLLMTATVGLRHICTPLLQYLGRLGFPPSVGW